jgi:hypothetical protein
LKIVRCQMTVWSGFIDGGIGKVECNRPAKYRILNHKMNVEFVCGIHARSINKLYERTGQTTRCLPLNG